MKNKKFGYFKNLSYCEIFVRNNKNKIIIY